LLWLARLPVDLHAQGLSREQKPGEVERDDTDARRYRGRDDNSAKVFTAIGAIPEIAQA